MEIHGFNKTTLLDYPEHIAATVFTGGCNFRCPFCHNGELVLDPGCQPSVPEEEVLAYLKKRQGILQGVCITGGEPTLQRDLRKFLQKIKELEYPIKLDTNGYMPGVLWELLQEHLIDYVAMDIKNSPERYPETVGIPDFDTSAVTESIGIIMSEAPDYEFRTTVVAEFHDVNSFIGIGGMISGARRYFLQGFRDSGALICPGLHAASAEEMERYAEAVKPFVEHAELRGI